MKYQRPIAFSTLALFASTIFTLPVLADDVLIARLGYQEGLPAKVYLDITPPKPKEAETKAQKKLEKAEREAKEAEKKRARQTAKLLKEEAKQKAKQDPVQAASASAAPVEDTPQIMQIRTIAATSQTTDTTSDTKAADSTPVTAPAPKTKLSKAQLEAQQLALHEKMETERIKRSRARMEALYEKHLQTPVEGAFYLYNLKNDRILHDGVYPKVAQADSVAPYYVEFKEKPPEGLYEVAVKGSGHLSELPLWISNSIYWEALKPVAASFNKSHCPLEEGKYKVVQQCYQLSVLPNLAAAQSNSSTDQKTQVVEGGWYSNTSSSLVKSTVEISDLAQTLLRMYEINPKAFKYLEIPGESYEQSDYPDVLDEANWGLQYLLTIQQPDGSFPQGIGQYGSDQKVSYYLAPSTPEANARAVMALATAAKTFRHDDLSLSVKFMRAAEQGWLALEKTKTPINPEWVMLASSALADASDNPTYAQAFDKAKSLVKTVTPQTALMLGDTGKDIPMEETTVTGSTKTFIEVLPWLVELQRNQSNEAKPLAAWVTDLFGYERVPFKKDDDLEMASPQKAPLQWAASKTGEAADRLGDRFNDTFIHKDIKAESGKLKTLEQKEKEAKALVEKGYEEMALSPQDNVYLAYALVLLNQQTNSSSTEGKPASSEKPAKPKREYKEPMGSPKGYWPKLI